MGPIVQFNQNIEINDCFYLDLKFNYEKHNMRLSKTEVFTGTNSTSHAPV